MSRCFPFPPPGYEKRARIDDTDLLTKEKRKEKKHKKDKDSGKREGKKDKERSKEKHSDKKDRKEKHRDKERSCEKEKYRTLDEKSIAGQPKCYIGEKLVHNLQNVEIKDSKYVQELARRIRDEEKATESQAVQKITVAGQRKSGFPDRVVESNIAFQLEEKEKIKDEKENCRKANGQRNYVDTRSLENGIGGKCYLMDDKRNEGIVKPMEKDAEKQKKRKENNKHRESDGNGNTPQHKDQENKSKSKDKDRAKEKKKEEKLKEINEHSKQQPKLNKSGKESLNTCNAKQLEFSGMNGNCSFSEGNFGKRKELDKNGLTLDNGIRPHKLSRSVCFSHPVVENGRKLKACQTVSQVTCGKQVIAGNFLLDIKEHSANGFVGQQRPNAFSTMSSSTLTVYENGEASAKQPFVGSQTLKCSTRPKSPRVQVYDNDEASTRLPHPDSKYLIQILSVPKMEEWSDINGQDWLFSSNCLQSKKPKAGSPQVERIQHVWAEALQIESADVYALPYVIPF